MALTQTQYDSILHAYDERQQRRRMLIDERRKEIYTKLPEYKQIDNKIASESIRMGIAALSEGASTDELADTIESLRVKKNLILTNAGYSINYLDPPYICPYCKDTGYIETELCSCFRQAILDCSYEQSNIKDMLSRENFDTLSYEYQVGEDLTKFKNAEKIARQFVLDFDREYKNILFQGEVGTGKSFLSNCIANELIKTGHSVIYFSSSSLFETISSYKFKKNGKEVSDSTMSDIYNCDLLVIDDLGTELTNQFVISELFSILNERDMNRKSTIISTNCSSKELSDTYSNQIFSRLYSRYEICELSGNDIRIYKKRIENRK